MKQKNLVIRMDQELLDRIDTKAKSMGLSMSSYVRMLVIQDLDKSEKKN